MQQISGNRFNQDAVGQITRLSGARHSLRLAAFVAALVSLSVFATPLEHHFSDTLERFLKGRVLKPKQTSLEAVDGIIVLGGSTTRVRAALLLAKQFPNAEIVLSGPGSSEIAMVRADKSLNGRVTIDRRAKNTYENALYSKQLIGPTAGANWVAVTSAVHMPRAFGVFQAINFSITPWPVTDTPTSAKLRSCWVWHEVFGLIYYRIFGRTQDLLPHFD